MTELENVVPSIRKTFPLAVVPGLPHCTARKQSGLGVHKNNAFRNPLVNS